jgi:integrase
LNKISFILKNPNTDPSAILLLFTCYDGRLKYYTGEKAGSKWPDVDDGTAAQLDRIKRIVREMHVDYKIKGEPLTKALLASSLDKALHKKKPTSTNLFTAMRQVVEKMRIGEILTPDNKIYAKGTIKNFNFSIDVLEKFQPDMTIRSVSIDTYKKFITWCQSKDYSTNYIGAQIKNWKTLGRAIGGNPIFDDEEFKKIQEATSDVYLDEKELGAIMRLKLRNRESLARDWFILDCYTGLRVSDLVVLNKKNYHNGYITIANEKTGAKVVIPSHPIVKKILGRYKGFPPPITDVEINRTIKKVAEKAGITEKVLFTITKGGKRKDSYMQKWEMVSNHTARRSFITNLRKNGVADSIVMKLTGIRSAATLQRYDKLSADEAAKIAAKLKFFK